MRFPPFVIPTSPAASALPSQEGFCFYPLWVPRAPGHCPHSPAPYGEEGIPKRLGRHERENPWKAYPFSGLGELAVYRLPNSWIRGCCLERILCWEMEPRKGRFFNMRHSVGREHKVKGHMGQGSLSSLKGLAHQKLLSWGGTGAEEARARLHPQALLEEAHPPQPHPSQGIYE